MAAGKAPARRPLSAFTIALMAGNRNLGMLLAVMIDTAHPDFHLFVAVGQFPIYMLPALAVPIYRRVLEK